MQNRPEYPSPDIYGWLKKNNIFEEVMTTSPPAPDALVNLVVCNCKRSMCSNLQCNCKKAKLQCTDICKCSMQTVFEFQNTDGTDAENINENDIDTSDDEDSTEDE